MCFDAPGGRRGGSRRDSDRAKAEPDHDGHKTLAITRQFVQLPTVEHPMKSSGVSLTEIAIGLVLLGVCIALFVFGVQLLHSIQ
jgi:hypothetical protein